jgi:hypothetical protein
MGVVWSLPVIGLNFANKLNQSLYKTFDGTLLDYQSSVDHELIKVEDLGMGLQLLRPKSTGLPMQV